MMNLNTLPPPSPSGDAIAAAYALIALITDPAAAQARLEELNAASKQYRAAIAEHAGVSAQAAEVAAAQAAGEEGCRS
jgi:hypothetical protein